MKNIRKMAVLAVWIVILMTPAFNPAAAEKKQQQGKSEEEMGIRKESLYSEDREKPEHGEYSKTEPGKSKRIERAFENSPPLIPHDLTGMLPLAETNNACLNCHMPEQARSLGATPIPKSHFVDMETGLDLKGGLDGRRYPCMECHVPQVKIPEPIKNTFKADFRSKKSKKSSDLLDSLNEGVKAE